MSKDTKQKKPKVILGQNLSTRVRSPYFWTGVVGILGSAVVSFGGLLGVDLSSQVDSVTAGSSNIIEFIFLILGLLGVSVDPNSKGVKDSEIVRTDYTKPRNDKDPNEFIQWQNDSSLKDVTPERKEKEPEEFDTSQPFTDDSDEVEFDVAEYEDDEELPRGASKFHDDSVLKDGKEDESVKDDFVENIDDVVIDDSVNINKEDTDKVVKKTVTKEVTDDKKESDK